MEGIKKNTTFAPSNQNKPLMNYYVVTAFNKLTGGREVISLPMSRRDAREIVRREMKKDILKRPYYGFKAEKCTNEPNQKILDL